MTEYLTDNLRIRGITEVSSPEAIQNELPISEAAARTTFETRKQVQDILHGRDDRSSTCITVAAIRTRRIDTWEISSATSPAMTIGNSTMTEAPSPLIQHTALDAPIVWRDGQRLTVRDFLADVQTLAVRLPDTRYQFNCCEDRYAFMVAFAATLVRGQTNLMPPSRAPEVIRDIATDYPDACYLSDEAVQIDGIQCHHFEPGSEAAHEAIQIPEIAADRSAPASR